jgi:hypothetical protein
MSMRMAASCCQPLQVIELPRGARIEVGIWVSVSTGMNRCYLLSMEVFNAGWAEASSPGRIRRAVA